jgi:glucosylceramidase
MKTFLSITLVIFVSLTVQSQKVKIAADTQFLTTGKTVKVYTSSETGNLRLSQTNTLQFVDHNQPVEKEICIFADPDKKFQTFLGIGGALTDASAETFAKLPESKKEEFLKAYYDKENGIGYSFARTNINSCDFSSDSYTYIAENDAMLKTFTVKHDMQFRIPFIKKAIQAAGGRLPLYISPWSPPAWMKDNNDMLHGGKLFPRYFQNWADYFVKFIQEYEKNGIPIWGLTVQNEPMAAQKWESCIFTAEEEKDFVKKFLGPTLQKAKMGAKKIIIWDHNRDLIYQRASEIFKDKEAAKYIWGTGFHWYEDWNGGTPQFENIARVNEAFPGKNLLFTEGCNDSFDFKKINDWSLGERYGRSMINDFNNGTVGWTDWNVLLDEQGGPNHAENFCFAPVHYNTKTGELIYTSEFYYIGHFSKFIRPGARRITSVSSRSVLLTTAFRNNNGNIAVIVMNQDDKPVPYYLWVSGKSVSTTIPGHSISTLVIE